MTAALALSSWGPFFVPGVSLPRSLVVHDGAVDREGDVVAL